MTTATISFTHEGKEYSCDIVMVHVVHDQMLPHESEVKRAVDAWLILTDIVTEVELCKFLTGLFKEVTFCPKELHEQLFGKIA